MKRSSKQTLPTTDSTTLGFARATLRTLDGGQLSDVAGGTHPTTITITTLLLATCKKQEK